MANVQVWNLNTLPFKQMYQGEEIVIPAQSYIEMEFFRANDFVGMYYPVKLDQDGSQTVASYKKLRIVTDGVAPQVKDETFKCMQCSECHKSEKELMAHLVSKHAGQNIVDPLAEKALEESKNRKKAG